MVSNYEIEKLLEAICLDNGVNRDMSVRDCIKERKSNRSFTSEVVPKQTILNIIEAGCQAPSAKNRQPWYFVILQSKEKNKVADSLYQYSESHKEKIGITYTAEAIKESSALILIFYRLDDIWQVSDTLAIGACVENMLLYATEIQVGSLWIRDTIYIEKEISKLYGDGKSLCCTVALGFPSKDPTKSTRLNIDNLVKWR